MLENRNRERWTTHQLAARVYSIYDQSSLIYRRALSLVGQKALSGRSCLLREAWETEVLNDSNDFPLTDSATWTFGTKSETRGEVLELGREGWGVSCLEVL